MKKRDDFEEEIYNYFSENKEVPQEITDSIWNIELKKNKRIYNFYTIRNIIVTAISLATISTGIVFAKDISQFTKKLFFDSKKGVETAIENGYIYDINENSNIEKENKVLESQDTNIKISRMIMDDYTLNIEMMLEIEENIDLTAEHINFPDMIITDDMNNVLYCSNTEKVKQFCNKIGKKSDYNTIKEMCINSSANVFMKGFDGKYGTIECNLTAGYDKFPVSKKIYIQLNTIEIEGSENTYTITGDWECRFTVPETFIKRETAIYNVVKCNNDNIDKNLIKAEVYETGMKFDMMSMYWGNFEEWSQKTEEIRKQDAMASQLIKFEKSYVENEKGEKFYSSKSSYAGTGITTDGYLRFWNTFNLTKYDMTDKLKVVLVTIENDEIIIELEK